MTNILLCNNLLHCRYLWLDKLLPKTDLRTIIIKILADQFFAAPFFAITFFFGMGILEDKRMSECWKEFVKKFPAVYLVSNIGFLTNRAGRNKIPYHEGNYSFPSGEAARERIIPQAIGQESYSYEF